MAAGEAEAWQGGGGMAVDERRAEREGGRHCWSCWVKERASGEGKYEGEGKGLDGRVARDVAFSLWLAYLF